VPNPKRTQADIDIVLALHAQGVTRNDINRQTGYSTAWISNVVRDAGLTFARGDRVKAATEAKTADNKARRAKLVGRMYDRAETLLNRLEAPTFDALVPTGPGIQSARELNFVPAGEERNLATSIAVYLDKAMLLEKVDAVPERSEAQSMLGRLAEQLGVSSAPSGQPEATGLPEGQQP
jgi:putative ribosome biogenesis GTPase RsgA